MNKLRIFAVIMALVLILSGCSSVSHVVKKSQPWPDDMIQITTKAKDSQLVFDVQNPNGDPITYTILYNGKFYKTYTKTETQWSILYDYSFRDTTRVTIQACDDYDHYYERSVLVIIDPKGFDFNQNDLEIYFAGAYPVTLKEIASYKEHLVSIDISGNQITGDYSDLLSCDNLRRLELNQCTQIEGNLEALKGMTSLTEIKVE